MEKENTNYPKDSFEVDFELKYQNKIIGNQRNSINFQKDKLKEVEESEHFVYTMTYKKLKKWD